MDVNIRIAGRAGQGVQTTGNLLVGSLGRLGVHVFATQSYMSRIRGGLNWVDVRVGAERLFSGRGEADILVALNAQAHEVLSAELSDGAISLIDGEGPPGGEALPLSKTAREIGGSAVMANTVAAGAVFAVLGYDVDALCEHLGVAFAKAADDVLAKNIQCARRGFELGLSVGRTLPAPAAGGAPVDICSGARAIALAAAAAGVKFVTAYPMSPSTGIFTHLASMADEYGMVVEQAEDEIAAVNMICGACYAGVPAMTTTSGGGFALMGEGVSLAGMLELPIFVLVSQRPSPATGLPTRTAQEDLKGVINAGHGDFPRAVYAPGTAEEAYELTRLAIQTAHKFQSPTFLLTDQFQVDTQTNLPPLSRKSDPIDRHIVPAAGDYIRYAASDSGVSPRAIPGGDGFVVSDSDEHTPDGHITEDLHVRVAMQNKRLAKGRGLLAEVLRPTLYGPADAAHLLVCWGSTYGPCREAVDRLTASGASAAMLHFPQVYPVDVERTAAALAGAGGGREKITFVEGNATGQFATVLRSAGVPVEAGLLLKYDGMPLTGEEIAGRIMS